MLGWFADAPDPDAGLFGFRRISEALGSTPWYLGMLRDEGQVAERLARCWPPRRYATDLLEREPPGVRMLGEDLHPADVAALREMTAAAGPPGRPRRGGAPIRAVRRRELFRIAAGDLFGLLDVAESAPGCPGSPTPRSRRRSTPPARAVREQQRLAEAPTRIAIVAMGRYGGFELSYGSDADVMFVHDPLPGADQQAASTYAQAVANELRRLLALPVTDPPLEVDADLRPEGKQGPLVRTLDSYAAYYAKWSTVWESQALLRADAVVGDEDLRRRFTELIDPLRFPADGHHRGRRRRGTPDQGPGRRRAAAAGRRPADPPQARPRRARRRRVDRAAAADAARRRRPRAAHAAHARRAGARPREAGLLDPEDAEALSQAWRTASRVRNAITLVRGKAGDQLPRDARERGRGGRHPRLSARRSPTR